MIENSHFIGGEISFFDQGKTSRSIMNRIFLSNVCFERSQKRIVMKDQNITLSNVTILDTLNGILIHNCVANIDGTLLLLGNKREFIIQQINVTIHKKGNSYLNTITYTMVNHHSLALILTFGSLLIL